MDLPSTPRKWRRVDNLTAGSGVAPAWNLWGRGGGIPEWRRIVDDLIDLSTVEIEQDGRRALLRTAPRPSIDPICRAIGLTLPPVYQEQPPIKTAQDPN